MMTMMTVMDPFQAQSGPDREIGAGNVPSDILSSL